MPTINTGGIGFNRTLDNLSVVGTVALPVPDAVDVLRITTAGSTPQIAGLGIPGQHGRFLLVVNASAAGIDFLAESTQADEGRRFGRLNALTLAAGEVLIAWYDGLAARWRLLSGA